MYKPDKNFIEIEKEVISLNKEIDENQWSEEMKYYNKTDSIEKENYDIIVKEMFTILTKFEVFSKEKKNNSHFIKF